MRKPAILLIATGILLCLTLSCSKSPVDSNPDSQKAAIVLTPRPEFIDLRPAEIIQSCVMEASEVFIQAMEKKPPKPPPDTGSQDPNPDPAHKYAYIVGISDYDGTVNDLNFCDDDAQAMKSYLQSQGFTVQMDLDQNATADNIQAGLQWLEAQAAAGDEIAFCYSGHGTKYPGYGSCIISTDMYYMTHGFVMQYINAAACTKKLVTLDACVIGDFHLDCQTGTFMATASTNSDSYDVYAEEVAPYAEAEMKAWAKPYHLRVSPAHTDAYEGMFDI